MSGGKSTGLKADRPDPEDYFKGVEFAEEANRLSPAELDERLKRLGELEVPEDHRSFWDGLKPE